MNWFSRIELRKVIVTYATGEQAWLGSYELWKGKNGARLVRNEEEKPRVIQDEELAKLCYRKWKYACRLETAYNKLFDEAWRLREKNLALAKRNKELKQKLEEG